MAESREELTTIFMSDVVDELQRAMRLHGECNSNHEGYAVILEELDEFWDEVKERSPNRARMYNELVQVAAMAAKTAVAMRIRANYSIKEGAFIG